MSTSKKFFSLRDIGIIFYLGPFRLAAAALPGKITQVLGLVMGHIYTLLANRRRRRIQQRLKTALGNSRTSDEIFVLSRRCILNAVATHVDALVLEKIDTQTLLRNGKVEGVEHLENALSKGKGVLLITGHFTGSNIAFRFVQNLGYPLLGGRKRHADHHGASRLENRYLSPYWSKVISRGSVFIEGKEVGLRIITRLRENGIVFIRLDVPFSQHLLTRAFLGHEREFPVDFLRIAYATEAAVVPMMSIGNSSAFSIYFEEAVNLVKVNNKDEFVSKNIDTIVKILESQILKEPSHWLLI